nr:hypothetical protein [Gammaproteobacteria bacterium]
PNTPSKLPEVPVVMPEKDKPLRFVMLAGFVPHIRGIELLVKIWASLVPGSATLNLYLSNISEANKQHLLSLAGAAANKSFFIKAPIKEDEIIETLVNYDVGIIPYLPDVCLNHRYCCPGKFGQYLKAGLAVLSSNTENITQAIDTFNLGAVYPVENFSESSEVFQAMIDSPEKIETMKHNAKHFFESEYHWDIFAKGFVTEINRIFSSYNLSSSLNQPA